MADQEINKDSTGERLVLIVDDDEGVRNVCKRQLAKLGFATLTAVSGNEAVTVYEQRHAEISVVLLDLTMPGMDGMETFREMRKINPSARVILTSGYDGQESINRFEGIGLAGFVNKPYRLAELMAKINEALEK